MMSSVAAGDGYHISRADVAQDEADAALGEAECSGDFVDGAVRAERDVEDDTPVCREEGPCVMATQVAALFTRHWGQGRR